MKRIEFLKLGGAQHSLLGRLSESVRSYRSGPSTGKSPELARWWGGGTTSTGIAVNEYNAMNFSAVWNAVGIISGHVGAMPLKVYQRRRDGGKEPVATHPAYRLLHDAPNPEMSSVSWRETAMGHLLLWGNSFSEIERDNSGRPVALWPLSPAAVTVIREGGILRYRVMQPSGGDVVFDAHDMLHVRGLSDDGITGYSVIAKARESIGLGLAMEKFGATFFGNGATFGGVLSYPGPKPPLMSGEGERNELNARHVGVERSHRFLMLYGGARYERLGIPPEDAQFLESRRFQVEEIARWFNLPVHKLKNLDRSTNNNIEHQALEYVQDTLWPWLRRWEAELNRKLLGSTDLFAEFTLDGLLRGDAHGRSAFYKTMTEIGAMSINEVRARENLNPVQGGDQLFVQKDREPVRAIRGVGIPAGIANAAFEE